jgi:hypothetical protein
MMPPPVIHRASSRTALRELRPRAMAPPFVHSVGADQQIAGRAASIGEADRDRRAVLLDGYATRAERDVLIPHRSPPCVMEVRAVHAAKRCAPADFPGAAERHPARDLAALPIAKVPRLRANADRPEVLSGSQPVQNPDRTDAAGEPAHGSARSAVRSQGGASPARNCWVTTHGARPSA